MDWSGLEWEMGSMMLEKEKGVGGTSRGRRMTRTERGDRRSRIRGMWRGTGGVAEAGSRDGFEKGRVVYVLVL